MIMESSMYKIPRNSGSKAFNPYYRLDLLGSLKKAIVSYINFFAVIVVIH